MTLPDSTSLRAGACTRIAPLLCFLQAAVLSPLAPAQAQPAALRIFPAEGEPGEPYGSEPVRAPAGTVVPLVAKLFDGTGAWLSAYETDPRRGATISWKVDNKEAGALSPARGHAVQFLPRTAYSAIVITAACEGISDSVKLGIVPGKPMVLSVESDSSYRAHPNRPDPVGTVSMSGGVVLRRVYAILRDSDGNFVSPSTTTMWTSSNTAAVEIRQGHPEFGQAHLVRKAGTGSATVTVIDRATGRMASFMVVLRNIPPELALPDTVRIDEDAAWSYTVAATDSNNDALSFGLTAAPPGATIDSQMGVIAWTPDNSDIGPHVFGLWVTDNHGDTVGGSFVVEVSNVNDRPEITAADIPDSVFEDSEVTITAQVSDDDAGDTLRASWARELSWLGRPKIVRGGRAGTWRVSVTGVPPDEHKGANRFALVLADRLGASDTLAGVVFVQDTDDPPQTHVLSRVIAGGAVKFTVRAVDDYDTVCAVLCTLRSLTDPSFVRTSTTTDSIVEFFPIPDGRYELICRGRDAGGLVDETPDVGTVAVGNASSARFDHDGETWHMISVPGRGRSARDLKNGGVVMRWDESRAPGDRWGFYTPAREIRVTEPGRGYWRRSRAPAGVSVAYSSFVNEPLKLAVRTSRFGWTQVATPFVYPVKWPGAETVWAWDPVAGDYVEQVDKALWPFQGYFVLADSSGTVTFKPRPYYEAARTQQRREAFFESASRWMVRVRMEGNGVRDEDNLFGVDPGARNGFDRMDRPEPPRVTGRRYLFFARPDFKRSIDQYASDIRRDLDDVGVFQLGMTEGRSVVLTFEGANELDSVYLFLGGPRRVMPVRADTSYLMRSTMGAFYRTVFATPRKDFLADFPYAFIARAPYPNPFNLEVVFRYTLPYRWEENGWLDRRPHEVSLTIYDGLGKVVRDLVHRKQPPGNYFIPWDSKTNTGVLAPSGQYFAKIKAGMHQEVKRVVLVR